MTAGLRPLRQPVLFHARQNPVRVTSRAFQPLSKKDVYQISCGGRYTAPHITGVSSPKIRGGGTGRYWVCAVQKEDENVFENGWQKLKGLSYKMICA
jgi:hypothetical protein